MQQAKRLIVIALGAVAAVTVAVLSCVDLNAPGACASDPKRCEIWPDDDTSTADSTADTNLIDAMDSTSCACTPGPADDSPPQTIISEPVQTAEWLLRPPKVGALTARHESFFGSYAPPVSSGAKTFVPPQMLNSVPLHTADTSYRSANVGDAAAIVRQPLFG
jgi:hypothetical protein